MDRVELLARFDLERRRPAVPRGYRIDSVGPVVRVVGEQCWVSFSDLDPATADRVVAEQASYFRSLGREVEWKVYGHDRPVDLGDRLRAAGFRPDPSETLMVYDLARPLPVVALEEDMVVERVRDSSGLAGAMAASEEAFGTGQGWRPDDPARWLQDPDSVVFLARAHGTPIASARLEVPEGHQFAGLWGGGTSPAYRGRGVYRALVVARAELARERGFRFLTVDALETSRPILERLGFEPMTSVTGWLLAPDEPENGTVPPG